MHGDSQSRKWVGEAGPKTREHGSVCSTEGVCQSGGGGKLTCTIMGREGTCHGQTDSVQSGAEGSE